MKSTLVRLVSGTALLLSVGAAWAGSTSLAPLGPATFRWMDIGDYVYGASFRSTYAYSPSVDITYSDSDSSFTGSHHRQWCDEDTGLQTGQADALT